MNGLIWTEPDDTRTALLLGSLLFFNLVDGFFRQVVCSRQRTASYLYFYVLTPSPDTQIPILQAKCKVFLPSRTGPGIQILFVSLDGHGQHNPNRAPPPRPPLSKAPITVVGIPSVSIQDNRLHVGSSESSMFNYPPRPVTPHSSI